jgi:integrase
MASIRKRTWQSGDETRTAWVADYSDQNGKRRLKTFRTKKEADAFMVEARGEVARGVHTADSSSATVAEAAELWIKRCDAEKLERATLRQYRQHVDLHILPRLGREKLSRLNVPAVESFKDTLLTDHSRAMAQKILRSLKGMLKDAARRGLIAHNPAHMVKITGSSRHKKRPEIGGDIPSKAEVRVLLDAAPPPRWRAFLMVAVFTGLRASELRGLTWDHVDFAAQLIRVRQRADRWNEIGSPKSGGSRRDVPMAPMVVNALKEWRLACPPGGLVFPTGTGKVESLSNIRKRLAPIMLQAGLADADGRPKYGLHAFRHFFASWLIDQGFGPKRVQSMMGHATINMTFDTYGHLFPAEDDHDRFAAGELAVVG